MTDLDGRNARDIALPGPGFVSNLQSADRGERIGFTFSDATLGTTGGRESKLFTASAADDAPPVEIGLNGGDVRVADWRFVPDTDSMLVLTFDSRLLLTDAQGGNAAPLGSALSIDGIARGSSVAIVERLEGIREIDLTDGSEQALVAPVDPPGMPGRATPVPGAGAGTIRSFADIGSDGAYRATTIGHVDTDGTVRALLEVPGTDTVLQTCVSPSGRYAAVLVAPKAVDNPFDATSCRCPGVCRPTSSRSIPARRSPLCRGSICRGARCRPDDATATRDDLAGLPVDVAPRLLGAHLETVVAGERVVLRLTEVEAYHGLGTGERPDPVPTPGAARPRATPRCGANQGSLRVPEPRHPFVRQRGLRPDGVGGCAPARRRGGDRGRRGGERRRRERGASSARHATSRAVPDDWGMPWACGIRSMTGSTPSRG